MVCEAKQRSFPFLIAGIVALSVTDPGEARTAVWDKVEMTTAQTPLVPGQLGGYSLYLRPARSAIRKFSKAGGPYTIAGLAAWYGPESAYSEGVWEDLSGMGNHTEQPDNPLRPSGISFYGKWRTLEFDGKRTVLRVPSINGSTLGKDAGYTLVMVLMPGGYIASDVAPYWWVSGSAKSIVALGRSTNATVAAKIHIAQSTGAPGRVFSLSNGVGADGQYGVFPGFQILVEKVEAGASGARTTSIAFDSFSSYSAGDTSSIEDASPNYFLTIGGDPDGRNNFYGHIGEVLIYNRALTTSETALVTGWLGKKWQIDTDYLSQRMIEPESAAYLAPAVLDECTALSRCTITTLADLAAQCSAADPSFDVQRQRCLRIVGPVSLIGLRLDAYVRVLGNDGWGVYAQKSNPVPVRLPRRSVQ